MKKILILAFLFIASFNSSIAIEEIVLEKEDDTLDVISDIYYGNVEEVPAALKLFTKDGLKFENSYISSLKAAFLFEGNLNFVKTNHNDLSIKHSFSVVEPMLRARFNEEKTEAMFDINLMRDLEGFSNKFTEKISAFYVSHEVSKHQKILFGQGSRIPSTYNGSLSTMQQEFILKSLLGRTLGDARALGIRNIAEYQYVDYDIGIYDSTRYMKDFGEGVDFTGRIIFKPLGSRNEETGKLNIGGAYSTGNYKNSYSQYSIFLVYDYNKLHFRTEYAGADGYNSVVCSRNEANGFYTSLGYDITPKLTLIGRYDYFNPDKDINNDNIQEFTAGITYNIFKNMKIMLNYVRRDYDDKSDSNMILFATRFII